MKEKSEITKKEEQIAETSLSSPASLDLVKANIAFPTELKGKYILDIGGGASSATFELRKLGAIAFAVDYRYKDLKNLRRSVDEYLLGPSKGGPIPPDEQDYVNKQRRSRNTFFETIDKGYNYYIAALAGNLPFGDKTFDLCFSVQTISAFLIKDGGVFMNSIEEGLRVLKPGGELQLQPWLGSSILPWSKDLRKTAADLHTYLREKGIKYAVEPTADSWGSPRLRITK